MRRKYIHKVDVYKNEPVFDNFSGNVATPVLIGSSWCKVSSVPTNKIKDFGLDIVNQIITIKTRWRVDINYFEEGTFFSYKGNNWMPIRIYNKDIINEEIVIIASATDGNTITPTIVNTFDNTFDNTFL